MSYLLPLFVAIPLAAAFSMMLVARVHRRFTDLLGNLSMLALLVMAVALYFVRPFNQVMIYMMGGWAAPIGINLVLDGLSHFLLLTVNLIAFLSTFYSISYMEEYNGKRKYYTLFMLMVAGMNGVVLTGDFFNLFVFLEIAAVASYSLVAFGTESEELEASFRYFVMGTIASTLVLLAIALIYGLTGTLNMADVAQSFPQGAKMAKMFIATLFIMGFGMKSALVPFHAWLPDAHPSAPAPISAMLSGVLIKALGVYVLVRIIFNVFGVTPQLSMVLMSLGVISMLVGVLLAIGQWDFKRLLAYHSISQIGYVMLGIGLATPLGIMGGLFHLFNHALFKSLLFLNAGAVDYTVGTRELKEMGGLAKKMPVTAGTSLAASMSIAGIPPFNGFWSKLFIILACVQAGRYWFALAAVVGSLLTLASFMKVQKYAFFETLKTKLEQVKEAPVTMLLPMIVLALLCFGVGLAFPYVNRYFVNPAVVAVMNGLGYSKMVLGGL
ncbi:complex I subunit 5 family protein [Candidatus Margulisiibacteriota bacterium]